MAPDEVSEVQRLKRCKGPLFRLHAVFGQSSLLIPKVGREIGEEREGSGLVRLAAVFSAIARRLAVGVAGLPALLLSSSQTLSLRLDMKSSWTISSEVARRLENCVMRR
jgi:hypothetical protein